MANGIDHKLRLRFVANTALARERGLMFAEPLEENEAALFVFPHNGRYGFWNKNVSFGLSLAFLDEHGRVLDLKDLDAQSETSVESCSDSVRYVVEASRGTFDRLGITPGDLVQYSDHALHLRPIREG